MSKKPFYIEVDAKIRTMDIPSMSALSDDEYRNIIDGEMFWVDHHDILKVETSGQPIATSIEQLNILIEELEKMKTRMVSKDCFIAG